MACNCSDETAETIAAGMVTGDAVIQYLICALDLLDKRQEMADINIDKKAYRQIQECRAQIKAVIKFIKARV